MMRYYHNNIADVLFWTTTIAELNCLCYILFMVCLLWGVYVLDSLWVGPLHTHTPLQPQLPASL